MQRYSIKDIENITGIKAHTLRIWEKRYKIPEPRRTPTNIRYYTDEDLRQILNIGILRKHGHKISQIVNYAPEEMTRLLLELASSDENEKALIDRLVLAMLEIDEIRFEHVLSDCIVRMGFENAVLEVVYPFLRRVGLLWQSKTVHPGQEHFVTNLIRERFIAANAAQGLWRRQPHKTFLLFLPEGELHELGLLFHSFIIRKFGHRVIYLGQWVPLDSAFDIYEHTPVDYVLTSALSMGSTEELNSLLRNILDKFENVPVILTQHVDSQVELLRDGRLIVNYSLSQFKQLLNKD